MDKILPDHDKKGTEMKVQQSALWSSNLFHEQAKMGTDPLFLTVFTQLFKSKPQKIQSCSSEGTAPIFLSVLLFLLKIIFFSAFFSALYFKS